MPLIIIAGGILKFSYQIPSYSYIIMLVAFKFQFASYCIDKLFNHHYVKLKAFVFSNANACFLMTKNV